MPKPEKVTVNMKVSVKYKYLEYGGLVTDTLEPSGVEIHIVFEDGKESKFTLDELIESIDHE